VERDLATAVVALPAPPALVDDADVEVLVASVVEEEDADVADPLRRRNEGETGASDVEK
jgi:hypothetical protein